ncbi:MAG: ribosome maturation factor RimM [Gammaproteobacteria bacterium]
MPEQGWIVIGRIVGLHGLQGWVKVISHTEPRDNLVHFDPLYRHTGDGWQPVKIADSHYQGKGVLVKFSGCNDRTVASAWIGQDLAIRRTQLPPPAPGSYYWRDLEDLEVVTLDGVALGKVDHLLATGANDVLVVKGERERLIPFLRDSVIQSVDFERGVIRVDWDPDF